MHRSAGWRMVEAARNDKPQIINKMKSSLKPICACALTALAFNSANGAVITVGDYLVSNNLQGGASDASYSESGAFGGDDTGQANSWGGDRRWGNDGAATSASWIFDGVSNGVYNVYASWNNAAQGNVSTAHYTGTDGFVDIDLEQGVGAEALSAVVINDGANDIHFASVGQVTIADGNFTLTVDDSVTGTGANTFIFADAVAITAAIPEPSSVLLVTLAGLGLVRRRRG